MTGKAKKPPTDAQMKAKALARWDTEGGAPESGDVSARQHHKRPIDANQLAKRIVDIASGQSNDSPPSTDDGRPRGRRARPQGRAQGREGAS